MKPIKTRLAGAVALALAGILPAAANADWTTRADLQVTQSRLFYDRSRGAFYVEARIENQGDNALTGPLRIVVEDSSLTVLDADGQDGGLDYFEVEPGAPGLAPGASSDFVRVLMQRAGRTRPTLMLRAEIDDEPFVLQLLHVSDIDSTSATEALENVKGFSALLDYFRNDASVPNSITVSSGDNWIPGPRYSAAADDRLATLLGVPGNGRGDVAMLNAMGFEVSGLGNHELDQSPSGFVSVIASETGGGATWPGAQFPYVSTNLDFTTDADTAPLVVANGRDAASIPNSLAGWATVDVNGETIGVVGATTPALGNITSEGRIGIAPVDFDAAAPADLDALAAEIQPAVDALTDRGVNKIILLAHMQQIAIEQALAPLLRDVDIIVAGGSNTLLADANDVLRPGDTALGTYPVQLSSAEGEPVLVVNTDGDYKYLGRLVSAFSTDGLIDPASLDDSVNGAYATTSDRLNDFGLSAADADATVAAIADLLLTVVNELDGNVLGLSQVYLDGRRGTVRTEEANLGNLTADANLWLARQTDDAVQVSIKNGGGIRAGIGQVSYPPGSTDPDDITYLPPEDGEVSQLDAQSALAFNNGLTLLTLTAEELKAVIEHGVAASSLDPANTQGRFPQVAGLRFSWDPGEPANARVQSLAVVDDSGAVIDSLIAGGSLVGDADRSFRIVTLGFLADGGDGYPFPGTDRVDLAKGDADPRTGLFTFAPDGTEQDALAEYMGTFFAEVGYDLAETDALADLRNQNLGLSGKTDTVADIPAGAVTLTKIGGLDLGGAEIVSWDAGSEQLFVTEAGGTVKVVDLSDPASPGVVATLTPATDITGFTAGGVTSVSVKNGLLAVAVAASPQTDAGRIAFYTAGGAFLGAVEAGALPDMVTWDRSGTRVLAADEGEPDGGIDAAGGITIVDVPDTGSAAERVSGASATQLDFTAFDAVAATLRQDGVRLFPDGSGGLIPPSLDFEPEYIALAADNSKAYVSLQENNALAVVDLTSGAYAISEIIALGTKDHSLLENALDPSNRDLNLDPADETGAIRIGAWPVKGLFMPDGIAAYDPGLDRSFVLTANEGDARSEDERIKDITLDAAAFPDAADLQRDANLGRLTISSIDGDIDDDGEYEELYSYGARSFTVWDVDNGVYSDSNDDIARVTAQQTPSYFNANDGDPAEFDNRSDDKGAEPEAVITGELDGRWYAFVGLERAAGGVMIYDVTNPALPRFESYTPGAADGDIALEGMVFIPAADSANGEDLLVTANEESGTIAVYRIDH